MEKQSIKFYTIAAIALAALSILVIASCASAPPPAAASVFVPGEWLGNSKVSIKYGYLEGKADRKNTLAWLGIPYAAPPVGDLRWQTPQPPVPWQGIRDAKRFGSMSTQRLPLVGWINGSEDSLYLNVWRPATTKKGLPVYVWIHGGGNSTGSASANPMYYGDALASKSNIVFVSVNYRLGIFGWFAHPALKNGDPGTDSGNFGTLDLIASLEWVRENIASFGGDPDNVTIAGESAGAYNVISLLVAPKARGLFAKAVVESGYRTTTTTEEAVHYADEIATKLAVRQGKAKNENEAAAFLASMSKEETARWLKAASPKDLMSLITPGNSGMLPFPYPIFDGTILPADGFAALADPSRSADVPLIIGTNKEETKLFQWLAGQNSRDPLYQAQAELSSALWKADGADSIADAFVSNASGKSAYLYRFDWGASGKDRKSVLGSSRGAKFGAFHSLEIPFFLQTDVKITNLLYSRFFNAANEAGRKELQSDIGAYLTNFIRTGNPNGLTGTSTLPEWQTWRFGDPSPSFIVFDADLEKAVIQLQQGRTTKESVREILKTDYPEPMQTKLREVLKLD